MKWYKIDCDIQDNLDMRKLIDEWGWDWFGRYCAIIGKVGMLVTEHCQTFALQTNDGSPFPIKLLSNDLSTNVERLTNFCQYLADNRLIDKDSWNSKNLIFIPKLKDRADEYTKKLLTKSRHSPDQEVEEEIDKKKSTVCKYDFESLWIKYPKPLGKKQALRHFTASVKTDEDWKNINLALDNYLKTENVVKGCVQFIKHGSTWFNNWQDYVSIKSIQKEEPLSGLAIQMNKK